MDAFRVDVNGIFVTCCFVSPHWKLEAMVLNVKKKKSELKVNTLDCLPVKMTLSKAAAFPTWDLSTLVSVHHSPATVQGPENLGPSFWMLYWHRPIPLSKSKLGTCERVPDPLKATPSDH
ncbi:acetyl-coenzyme A synthetase, cytoplasmic [Platysternon megacephalum]|uniref:Acetyl-coenzyme A synthetase, cytoplasmic n=1 Tax=Platysternon megacephalum TaxID=55544 RepID=A0A4D9EEP4_9SAUR|nr:acetyl-coenzyme A synthetase, cytoplasmic [Platysternon megacephalum]